MMLLVKNMNVSQPIAPIEGPILSNVPIQRYLYNCRITMRTGLIGANIRGV